MTVPSSKPVLCAIYTRVSTDSGLDQESLDAQYDAASAYIRSQAHAHWTLVRTRYDVGASRENRPTALPCSGCSPMCRPARSR